MTNTTTSSTTSASLVQLTPEVLAEMAGDHRLKRVLGPVTLLAVPVLGRFGERPDNPTLLDRDYTAGWLVLAGLTALTVAAAAVVRSRRTRSSGRGGR